MNLDEAKTNALELRQNGIGDGDILLALNRGGLTAGDAEEIVRELPGKNRASVYRVGSFDLRESKFALVLVLAVFPLIAAYFGGPLWFSVALFGLIGGLAMTFGVLGLRRSMRGEAPAYVNVRPHLQGIPLPFTVKTNPAFVAIQRLAIGMICAGLAFKIAMMAAHR